MAALAAAALSQRVVTVIVHRTLLAPEFDMLAAIDADLARSPHPAGNATCRFCVDRPIPRPARWTGLGLGQRVGGADPGSS